MDFHASGCFQLANHCENPSSPSPRNTQSTNGFRLKNASLSPKNSGPPKIKQLSGSNAFARETICIKASWLNNQQVEAMISGLWL